MSNFSITGGLSCEYSIYPSGQSFSASGGSGSVNVIVNSGCAWTAASNAGWINITSGSSGNGNGAVYYSVLSNSTTLSRTGTITIGGKPFTVTQSPAACSYTISPLNAAFESVGGTGSISVTSASGCNWTAVSNANWITVVSGSSGMGSGTVNYQVDTYPDAGTRTGTITIAQKTFTVTQTGQVCSYSISPSGQS
ncbi:MAG: BACON domain-containing carbohydrate-binding protein, partial [Desulfobacterales bacterium]